MSVLNIPPHKISYAEKQVQLGRKIYKLWYGLGSETLEERITQLQECGYSLKEIKKGLRSASRLGDGHTYRAKTNTAQANKIWEDMKASYGYRCAYCGEKTAHLTKDHIISIRSGGKDNMHNIVPACFSCNRSKNDKHLLDWPKFRKMQLSLGIY